MQIPIASNFFTIKAIGVVKAGILKNKFSTSKCPKHKSIDKNLATVKAIYIYLLENRGRLPTFRADSHLAYGKLRLIEHSNKEVSYIEFEV